MAARPAVTASRAAKAPIATVTKGAKPVPSTTAGKAPVKKSPNRIILPEPITQEQDPVSVMTLDQIADEDIREALAEKVVEAFEIKQAQKELKFKLDGQKADPKKGKPYIMGINEELTTLQHMAGVKTLFVNYSGSVIENTWYRGTSNTLSKEKLIAAGVRADIIDACYVQKSYVTCVTKLKGVKED